MRKRDILLVYASGLGELLLAAFCFAVVALILLQLLARAAGLWLDADAALLLCWQIILLLALWPGQRFWTIRRSTAGGHVHSVIGVPSEDDLRLMNRRTARRIAMQPRD